MKLQPVAFGLAGGILWALAAVILAIAVSMNGYGQEIVNLMSSVYLGYEPTLGGGFIGAIWAFLDAFIGCAIFAWLYNLFVK